MQLLMVSVPALLIPPPVPVRKPPPSLPSVMVRFDRVTDALALGIEITLPTEAPSMMVVLAPAPITFKLIPMVRCSKYVAAPTMTESPEAAREMAWPMVLQAVSGDLQSLLSLPFAPFTYHVVLAKADGDRARSSAKLSVLLIVSLRFMILLPLVS